MNRIFVATSLTVLLGAATAYSDPSAVDGGAPQGQAEQAGAPQNQDGQAEAPKTPKAHAHVARNRKAHARAAQTREGRAAAGLTPEERASMLTGPERNNVDLTRPVHVDSALTGGTPHRAAPIAKAPADADAAPQAHVDAAPTEAEPDVRPSPTPEERATPTPAKVAGGRVGPFDAWLSRLKAALALQADQQRNWSDFESAVREVASAKPAKRKTRDDSEKVADADPSPTDETQLGSGRLDPGASDLKALSDAAVPLYAGLDDKQRRVFRDMLHDYPHEHRERRGN